MEVSAEVDDFARFLANQTNEAERGRALAQVKLRAVSQAPDEAFKSKFERAAAASEIEPLSIEWLWEGFLPLGALSMLYGQEGDGKSTFAMTLAAQVSRGTLPGALAGQPGTVEIIAYEDDAAAVLVPRLLAAGADLDRVFIHGGGAGDDVLTLPDDIAEFAEAAAARGSKLIIVDPLPDSLREGLKDNNNADVRKGIVPLNKMAQEIGAAVLGITHPNKGATDAANKVMGSKAWRSVPRSVLIYGRDPDDLEGPTRIVAVSKANYAAKTAAKVKVDSVSVAGVEHSQPRAQLVGASQYTDQDVLAAGMGATRDKPETQKETAEKLLYRLLEDGGGEIAADVAYAAGEAVGISPATMRRARADIGATGRGTWRFSGLPV